MVFQKRQLKIAVIGIILFVFFLAFPFQKVLKNFFYTFSFPLQNQLWMIGKSASSFFSGILNKAKLEKENQQLRAENQRLLYEIFFLKQLEKENEMLRKALDAGLKEKFSFKIAKVISKDFLQDTLLVDKGIEDGISVGLPVITENKVIIGRIIKTYKNFSKVELISAKNFSFDVKIKEVYGKGEGKGNLQVKIEKLPSEAKIEEGEIVFTSGEGGIFPEGLLVGKIIKVKKSDVEPFQEVEVELFFKISDIENLFIVEKW